MQTTLLSTKLYIPQPRGALVPRPRLIERLDAGLRGKLTLVSAPAGYGKTTLVSEWVYRMGGVLPPGDGTALPGGGRTLSLQAAWLSLDASDNDPARFFGYLIAALQQIDPRIGAGIQPVLEPGADLAVEQLLIALINDIAASGSAPTASPSAERGGFALILDDYHVISALEIHRALDFMLDHLPPPEDGGGMHIVLVSRADPPMPLGRLRVQRQLTEIREADLRFTPDETACLFQDVMGLDLSAAEIERLDARTEGWVAGLQLAALSVQDRADRGERIAAFGGSHRHLIEYLAHEVMARQTEQVRTFLLCTSILERFSASLCDAVLERSQSIEILEQLERANLFLVPLDGERQWYRYHHLFADFLKRRLQRTLPALVPELYARASEWYESQGLLDEAIEHALAGEDVGRAARLLDKHVESYILNAEVVRVRRWVERLPEEARCSLPRLCVYYAWALEFEFQLGAAETTMAQARPSASFPASQIAVHADALSVYTALHSGRYARAVELARAALAALPAPDADTAHPAQGTHPADREHPADDLLTVRGTVLLGLGIAALELGQMEVAYEALQSALPLNRRSGHRYGVLSCLYYMMWIEDARGALSQELATGERGLSWIELWSGAGDRRRPPARPLAHIRQQMGLVYYERDDLDRAAVYLRQASEYYELVGSAYRATSYAYLVDLYNALGDLEKARGSLQKLVRNTLTPGFSLPATPLPAVISGGACRSAGAAQS